MTRTTTRSYLFRAMLTPLVSSLMASTMLAADDYWNVGNGNFNNNSSWLDNSSPMNTDIAVFNTAGPYTVNFPVSEITNQLHINEQDITFDLDGTIYSNDAIPFVSSSLIQVGVTSTGSLTLTSSPAGGKLTADNVNIGSDVADGTITVNAGAMLQVGSINFGDLSTTGTLVLNGGDVETGDLSITFPGSGVLTYNSGNLTATDTAVFNTGSAIEVNSGTLTASGFGTFQDGLTANAGGVVNLSGSQTVTGPGGVTLNGGSVNFSSGSLSLPSISGGTLGWSGGTIFYGSSLTIGTGGVLGTAITLDDKSLNLTAGGSITIESSGSLVLDKTTHGTLSADSISIAPNANFEYGANGGNITLAIGNLTIGNPALGRMTGPADATTIDIGTGGSITLTAGTLTIESGYSVSTGGGELNTSELVNDGTLTYNGGNIIVQNQLLVVGSGTGGGHINGSTTITIPSTGIISTQSTLTIDPTYSVNVHGNLQADASISVDGSLTVNTTGNVQTIGNLDVSSGSSLTINGGVLSVDSLTTAAGGTTTFNGGIVGIFTGDLLIGTTGGINAPQPTVIGTDDSISVTAGTTTIESGRTLSIQGGSLITNFFDETAAGTLQFHSGVLQVQNDDLEIGPNGVDGPEPTVVGAGSQISVAPLFMSGGELSVAAGRELSISGGFVTAKSLSVLGTATFSSGTLWLTGVGENLHVVDPSPGAGGISDPDSPVNINSNSSIRVIDGTVTIDAGQALQLIGGELRVRSIQEDQVDSFTYLGGSLHLGESDLVIGPGAAMNDHRLLGANPVLGGGDEVSIEDPNLNEGTVGNTTIESGGSLSINGGNFYTTANLTIDAGGSLSGYDPSSIPYGGLGGFAEIPLFSPASLLTNSGDISPGYVGQEIGELHYSGDYLQGATGELHLQLQEFLGFEQSDRFTIGGEATLGGTLTLTFHGYAWGAGDVFDLLIASGGLIGEFDLIDHPALPSGYSLNVDYEYNGGTTLRLTVIPEPASGLLMMSVLIGSGFVRRRIRAAA